jgi:hypothetical protein
MDLLFFILLKRDRYRDRNRLFLEHFPEYHSPPKKILSVRPEAVEDERTTHLRLTRSWFDKLTTNGFLFAGATVKRKML